MAGNVYLKKDIIREDISLKLRVEAKISNK